MHGIKRVIPKLSRQNKLKNYISIRICSKFIPKLLICIIVVLNIFLIVMDLIFDKLINSVVYFCK